MRTAGKVVSNLPAIEPYPVAHPVGSMGPSAVRLSVCHVSVRIGMEFLALENLLPCFLKRQCII